MAIHPNSIAVVSWLMLLACSTANCEEIPVPAGTAVPGGAKAAPSEAAADQPRQVQIEIRLIEISTTRMRALGFDWSTISRDRKKPEVNRADLAGAVRGHQLDTKQLEAMLDALRQNDLARVLAAPTVVTLEGRPATLSTGSFVAKRHPVTGKTKSMEVGTRVDVVPRIAGDDRCQIDLRIEWSGVNEGKHEPRFRRQKLDTAFWAESGKTFVAATATDSDEDQDETQLLVLVRPEIIPAPGPVPRMTRQLRIEAH